MGFLPPEGPGPIDRARVELLANMRNIELDQNRKRPVYQLPRDKIGIAIIILVGLVIAAAVVYVLLTGGFGNPPPPTIH
jgi:hypothetical protein